MDRFESIDHLLYQFAERYNAEIHKKGTRYHGIPPDKIVERRILWMEGSFGKGVIIQPNFISKDIDAPLWNFWNITYLVDKKTYRKYLPHWKKFLCKGVEFTEIEKNIEHLLIQSAENLKNVRRENLRGGK